jgi:hypothetical protein
MKKTPAFFFCSLALISVVWLSTCKSSTSTGPPGVIIGDPSFVTDIEGIFSNTCSAVTCHGAARQAELTLLRDEVYSNLVNAASKEVPAKKRVFPFNAEDSYVVIKLEGRQTAGARMPASGGPLSDTDIQNIKNWINKGAKNN